MQKMTLSDQSPRGGGATRFSALATGVCGLVLALQGCNSTPASSELQALEAQNDADKAQADALLRAAEKSAEAEGTANKAVTAAYEDARRVTDKSQAKATVAAEEAHTEILEARDDLRGWAASHMQVIDEDIAKARMDATGKGVRAQAAFTAAMVEVEAQRTALHEELATLDARVATDWAAFKSSFEVRMNALEARVSETRARL